MLQRTCACICSKGNTKEYVRTVQTETNRPHEKLICPPLTRRQERQPSSLQASPVSDAHVQQFGYYPSIWVFFQKECCRENYGRLNSLLPVSYKRRKQETQGRAASLPQVLVQTNLSQRHTQIHTVSVLTDYDMHCYSDFVITVASEEKHL